MNIKEQANTCEYSITCRCVRYPRNLTLDQPGMRNRFSHQATAFRTFSIHRESASHVVVEDAEYIDDDSDNEDEYLQDSYIRGMFYGSDSNVQWRRFLMDFGVGWLGMEGYYLRQICYTVCLSVGSLKKRI